MKKNILIVILIITTIIGIGASTYFGINLIKKEEELRSKSDKLNVESKMEEDRQEKNVENIVQENVAQRYTLVEPDISKSINGIEGNTYEFFYQKKH